MGTRLMGNSTRTQKISWREWSLVAFVALCSLMALLAISMGLEESQRARQAGEALSVSVAATPTAKPTATPTPNPLATPTPTLAYWEIQE